MNIIKRQNKLIEEMLTNDGCVEILYILHKFNRSRVSFLYNTIGRGFMKSYRLLRSSRLINETEDMYICLTPEGRRLIKERKIFENDK